MHLTFISPVWLTHARFESKLELESSKFLSIVGSIRHGGLNSWRENSFILFLNQKLKEILIIGIKSYEITGCGVFKAGIQNWKGFCIKINCSQMKLLNFENWTNMEPQ